MVMDGTKVWDFLSTSPEQTIWLGRRLGRRLVAGSIVCLFGELGAGKTTMVKGIAKGLGVSSVSEVISPSFVLVRCYEGRLPLYHFDLFRLKDVSQIYDIGCDEMFYSSGVSVIEWPQRLRGIMPPSYLKIELRRQEKGLRRIRLSATSGEYSAILKSLYADIRH